jgi:hypothetical protein
MNRKERRAKLSQLIKKTSVEEILDRVKVAMEECETDENNAGQSYAERFILKAIEAVEVPGLQED